MSDTAEIQPDPAVQDQVAQIVEKLRQLSPVRILEVRDFIDFVGQRDSDTSLTRSATSVSEPSFRQVWDNPEDAEYDRL
jgi:hypothetical protein